MTDPISLFVDMTDRRVIVFGGGPVALRKCNYMKGSDITIVSSSVLPEFDGSVNNIILENVSEDRIDDMISGHDLVVAATSDRELNDLICKIAKRSRIPVNSAHGGGDVLFPSVLEREGYLVAVSSKGKVPAFPPYVVEELDKILDQGFDMMLDLMVALRSKYSDQWDQRRRSEFYRAVLRNSRVREYVDKGDLDSAMEVAEGMGEEL